MLQSLTKSFACPSILINALKLPAAVPESPLGVTVIHNKPTKVEQSLLLTFPPVQIAYATCVFN